MRQVVVIDVPGGPAFVTALREIWDDGDAAFPIDRRLPTPARRALLARVRPHAIVTHDCDQGDALRRTIIDRDAPAGARRDALVVATSGSTGHPKLVVHDHPALTAHAAAVHRRLEVDPERDRWLACLPLNHLGGLGVVVRSVLTGTGLEVWPSPDADRLTAAPTELGSTLVSLVPTLVDRVDTSGFRRVVVGGSADLAERAPQVVRTYGLTETGGGVVYDGVPLDGTEVAIDDRGAISLRGPTTARGLRLPSDGIETLTDPDGWIRTGDTGSWARDGRLVVAGRASDLIITGGENVWPTPVEQALAAHRAIAEVAVVGRPDPDWGERVVAVVALRGGFDAPTLDDLRAWARRTLPPHALPREVVVVDALPRTALGKVRRDQLDEAGPPPDEPQ